MGWVSDAIDTVASPVSDVINTVGNTAGGLLSTAGNIGQNVINNPLPAALAFGTGNVAPLLSYAITPQSTSGNSMATSDLVSGLLSGIGGYLQNQSNVAGNQTAAQAAQFRPVGITSRFGSSNFQIDPTTGQLTGAGYNVSPELVGYQNRLSNLTNQGLTQAEQAQGQYAPLQQGAQSMFGLGNQYLNSQQGAPLTQAGLGYLNQSPQAAAQDWMSKQQALLQPGRDTESARLANQLQQTGRTGVSVAQGGGMGMSNPEYQALANARAQQDAQLAANAGQYGLAQQQAGAQLYGAGQGLTQQGQQFGAGLFGTGANNLNNYYSGQQAAYAPFTSALGQTNALEQMGQQPLALSSELAGRSSTAGAKSADYLKSAGQANPLASLLTGAGTNSALGTGLAGLFGNNSSSIFDTSSWMPTSTFTGGGDLTSLVGGSDMAALLGL
jgi:hypothetical protein